MPFHLSTSKTRSPVTALSSARRRFMQSASGLLALLLLMPTKLLAAMWNAAAFESKTMEHALQGLQVKQALADPASGIRLVAPDMAENGAVVQIEVTSTIPNTEAIAILVEKNPTPLIANFMFSNGALPYVVTRIKMAETADVVAIIKAGNQYYQASKRVEVQEGGCN